MRRRLRYLLTACFLVASYPSAFAQADDKSTVLLQTAAKAFGAGTVQDVSISATAQRIAGSMNETVQVSLEALASGSTRLTYQTSPNPLVEMRTVDANGVWSGRWTDSKGASHTLAYHNLLTEPDWFFPVLTVLNGLNSASTGRVTIAYIGAETFHGNAVHHLHLSSAAAAASQIPGLGQSELYLDAATLLPTGLTYNDHADNNVLVNIPVTVLFSSYAAQSGFLMPTHIQHFRNELLTLDLKIQDVKLNTGITITLPTAQ